MSSTRFARKLLKIIFFTALISRFLCPTDVRSSDLNTHRFNKDQTRPIYLPNHRDLFRFGRQRVGFVAGYGFGLPLGNGELDDLEFVRLAPQWAIGISDPIGGDSWYRGNFELVAEPFYLAQFEPRSGFAGGLDALVRYNFLREGRLIPFVEGGPGISGIDLDLGRQRDGFNFTLQAGIGFHYFLTDRASLTAQWRYHHISNARTRPPNRGLNSSLFMTGISFFFSQ